VVRRPHGAAQNHSYFGHSGAVVYWNGHQRQSPLGFAFSR